MTPEVGSGSVVYLELKEKKRRKGEGAQTPPHLPQTPLKNQAFGLTKPHSVDKLFSEYENLDLGIQNWRHVIHEFTRGQIVPLEKLK